MKIKKNKKKGNENDENIWPNRIKVSFICQTYNQTKSYLKSFVAYPNMAL